MAKPVMAWHWVGGVDEGDGTLPLLRDGRPLPGDGIELVHDGPVEMCASGLHASRNILDALNYAPGPIICRVECRDVVDEGDDKLVCRSRTIVWRKDATEVLRRFSRKCALDVAHLCRAAARDAAWDATWDATWDAARARQSRRLTAMVSAA